MVPSKLWQAVATLFLVFSPKTKNATSPGFYKHSDFFFLSVARLSYILGMVKIEEVTLDPRAEQLLFDRVVKF